MGKIQRGLHVRRGVGFIISLEIGSFLVQIEIALDDARPYLDWRPCRWFAGFSVGAVYCDGLWQRCDMDRYEEALGAIEGLIADEGIREDGRLPTERELSEKLGIGRRVLRRALGRLEEDGRIVRHQGRGTFLAGREPGHDDFACYGDGQLPGDISSLLEIANPVELVELRLSLEPVMCRLAALRSSPRDAESLRRQAQQTRLADSFEVYQDADAAFHRMIADLSRNSVFVRLQALVSTAMQDTALERFGESGHCFKRQAEHVAYHDAIVDAIAAHDANAAERLMREHLSDVHRSLFDDVIATGGMASQVREAS